MLPDFIKAAMDGSLKKFTSMRTISDALNRSSVGKKMFGEITKLLQIYLTIAVTTATAERKFSVLKQLKTWLRSTMMQESRGCGDGGAGGALAPNFFGKN